MGPVCSPVVVGRAVVYYRLVACGKGKGVMTMYRDGECSGQGKNVSFDKGCTPTVTTSYTFKCSNGTVGGGDASNERGAAQRQPLAIGASGSGGGAATRAAAAAAAAAAGGTETLARSSWLPATLAAVASTCLGVVAVVFALLKSSQPVRGQRADAAVALLSLQAS